MLSAATLLALAYGARVEDAYDRRMAPGGLRPPLKHLVASRRRSGTRPWRTVSVIRHGILWLRRLLHRGRLWSQVWLLPEPWPEPKPCLEINCHAPHLKLHTYPCQAPPPSHSSFPGTYTLAELRLFPTSTPAFSDAYPTVIGARPVLGGATNVIQLL